MLSIQRVLANAILQLLLTSHSHCVMLEDQFQVFQAYASAQNEVNVDVLLGHDFSFQRITLCSLGIVTTLDPVL